ncbi:hypothetical protein SAMN05414139_02915 [Burkholderia sp. D7]|nr:hypothetical protein SAMN05414139_02915 [Burkholderia sp. D7]
MNNAHKKVPRRFAKRAARLNAICKRLGLKQIDDERIQASFEARERRREEVRKATDPFARASRSSRRNAGRTRRGPIRLGVVCSRVTVTPRHAHGDVLRALRNLDYSPKFAARNYAQCFRINELPPSVTSRSGITVMSCAPPTVGMVRFTPLLQRCVALSLSIANFGQTYDCYQMTKPALCSAQY